MDRFSIDPVCLKTVDGKDLRFILTRGAVKRLRARFGGKELSELLGQGEEAAAALLYESLLDKGDMTEEQLSDVVPYLRMGQVAAAILEVCLVNPPTAATPPAEREPPIKAN
jgi:hypothetical protein